MVRRRHQALALLAVAAAFLPTAPLWAAEPSGEVKAGLPQLDPTLFPEQVFWLAISFAALYLLMSRVALPGVRRAQDKRRQAIADELTTAGRTNDKVKVTLSQNERALAKARTDAQAILAAMHTRMAQESAESQAAQKTELAARLRESEEKIAAVRDAAIAETRAAAADLAELVVEKVSGLKMQVRG